jgi:hypothetical protein
MIKAKGPVRARRTKRERGGTMAGVALRTHPSRVTAMTMVTTATKTQRMFLDEHIVY